MWGRCLQEIRLAPPSSVSKTHSWLNFHSPTARKTAKPVPLSHHPTLLSFGTRQTQVLIPALPQAGRASISAERLHHTHATQMQDADPRGDCAGAEEHTGALCFLLSFL